jgi:cysteine synthase B
MTAQLLNLEIELILPEDSLPKNERRQCLWCNCISNIRKGRELGLQIMPTKKVAEGGYMLNQFANDDNWKAHYKTNPDQKYGMILKEPRTLFLPWDLQER